MYKLRLGADDCFLILAPRWAELGTAWQYSLLALLLVVPLSLILWLYRYELRLISRLSAFGLLSLRLVILAVIWLAVGLQPHLAAIHVEETPGRICVAVDLSTSMDFADRQRTPAERAALTSIGAEDYFTRKQIVEKILSPDGLNLLDRLAQRHQVEIVGFPQHAEGMTASQLFETLADKKGPHESQATDLRQPLTSLSTNREPRLLGVLLFSDGQHNVGAPPYDRAEELGKQRIPIFPVVIGSKELPHDLMMLDVQAPTRAFKDMTVPIEIRCKVTNMPAQEMTVEMRLADKPVLPEHRQVINHDGADGIFTVRFQAKMDQAGTHAISIKAISKEPKEITLANNIATRFIRVVDDKAKVLLVDGEARWEYHYLANALLRDPKIAVERVVFAQPRIGLIKDDQLDKAGLPKSKLPELKADRKDVDPLLEYDCIILGDVSPEQLPIADRGRLEKYVSERGGTLVLLAGKRYLPLAYSQPDDPLAKMLPITAATELRPEAGFALRVSGEGKLIPFLNLGDTPDADVWHDLPKHYWGIVGKRKPAASVLVAPVVDPMATAQSEASDRGIIVQQNYGFGRVLFIGLDSTWRWRFRVGDTYHHRFWGQLARWSAAEKLLPAGNRHLRYGSREPVYAQGEEVELAARLGATLPAFKEPSGARMKVYRKNADQTEELVAEVPLAKHPRQANLLEAKVATGGAADRRPGHLSPGTYRIELDLPQYRVELAEPSDEKDGPAKGRDLFRILPREERELLDLSTNWQVMRTLAERSDGKLYTPDNIENILERLARRIERKEERTERKPWEDKSMVWWMLGLLLGLLTVEWGWRKWLDLP